MSNPDREAPGAPDAALLPALDERDRELLDYLVERAWQDVLANLRKQAEHDNQHEKRAA